MQTPCLDCVKGTEGVGAGALGLRSTLSEHVHTCLSTTGYEGQTAAKATKYEVWYGSTIQSREDRRRSA